MSPYPLVVVDPGHGGSDPGAVNPTLGLRESRINLDLALLFTIQAGPGFAALLTRTTDVFLPLEDRCLFANVNDAAAFLSFHCNACSSPSVRGFEVWTTKGQTKADLLATYIYGALKEACPVLTGRVDYDDGDPDKEADFYVLRHTVAPAVLVEFGFLSNDAEATWLNQWDNQVTASKAVADGVTGWLKGGE